MHLIEVRMLEGPNLFRLEPAVKLEVAIEEEGRGPATATGAADGRGRTGGVSLRATVPEADQPPAIRRLAAWLVDLRQRFGEGDGDVLVHRGADEDRWIVTAPWTGLERARSIAEAAWELTDAGVAPREPHGGDGGSGDGDSGDGGSAALLARHESRIRSARATPPPMLRDAERRVPIISISGTNGKSTVTRLITHILVTAGRRVGTTTSDGVLVDERMIDAGDWTGPGGAAMILARSDVDVAVLETARGGILLRGVGYESNDASVLTNVSADHLDLQGIHTLEQLIEVKSVIARITRAEGWVVLNADDPLVAGVADEVRARVAYFSTTDGESGSTERFRNHIAAGGRAYAVRRGRLIEIEAGEYRPVIEIAEIPITIAGIARHNVENSVAACAGARAMGATIEEVAFGLRDFAPSPEQSPGRLNLFRVGNRTVIVDFAHNEAGVGAVLSVAEGIAAGSAGRAAPITAIIGTAGDRPDDSLRAIARVAASRAQRIVIKETLHYLRGRTREDVIEQFRVGLQDAGWPTDDVPLYESETRALRAELTAIATAGERPGSPRVIVLMCHEERDEVFRLIAELGGRPVDIASELTALMPRLQERPIRR